MPSSYFPTAKAELDAREKEIPCVMEGVTKATAQLWESGPVKASIRRQDFISFTCAYYCFSACNFVFLMGLRVGCCLFAGMLCLCYACAVLVLCLCVLWSCTGALSS